MFKQETASRTDSAKKFLFFAVLLSAVGVLGGIASAAAFQGGETGTGADRRERIERRLQRLSQQLNLTQEQKDRIKSIWQDSATQLRALRDDTSLSQEAKRTRMRELGQRTREQIRAVLTAEQQQKLEELRQQARGQRGPRRGRWARRYWRR